MSLMSGNGDQRLVYVWLFWWTCRDWTLYLPSGNGQYLTAVPPRVEDLYFWNLSKLYELWANFVNFTWILGTLSTLHFVNVEWLLNLVWFILWHALCHIWRPIALQMTVSNYRQIQLNSIQKFHSCILPSTYLR